MSKDISVVVKQPSIKEHKAKQIKDDNYVRKEQIDTNLNYYICIGTAML